MEALVFAAPLSTLRQPTSQALAKLRHSALWFGPLLTNTTSMEGLMRSEVESSLSSAFLPSAGIYASAVSPSRRACQPRLRPRFAIIYSTPRSMIVTGLPTSQSFARGGCLVIRTSRLS